MGEKLPPKAADNWDLQAVVSCFSTGHASGLPQINTTTTTTTAAAVAADENSSDPLAFLANMEFDEEDGPFSFPVLLENNNNGFDELQDSCRPFFSNPSSFPEGLTCQQQRQQQQLNTSTASSMNSSFPPPVFGEQNNQHTQQTHRVRQGLQQQPHIQQQQQLLQQQPPMMMSSVIPLQPMMPSQATRSRKRKTPIKKIVCQVKFEQLSIDTWAWRKYGQKPIKGSPYPRNYYRCSSTKGCGARKQVERSNTDPSIYIVSYTGDHTHPRPTHRNSLAGSTRNKLSRTHQTPVTTTPVPPTIASDSTSSPLATTCQPPLAPPAPAEEKVSNTMENSRTKEPDHEDNKGFMEEEEVKEEEVDDLYEDLLIPNLATPAIDEDFFKGLKQFGTNAASGSGGNDC